MFEYKGTEKFDIGKGGGEFEYDFFAINGDDDFGALLNRYVAFYWGCNYLLDGCGTTENNTVFSSVVQAKMKEHNANLCLTLLEEGVYEKNVGFREMVVNELTPDGKYYTHSIYLLYFATQGAMNYFERGLAYAKSNLHNTAIRYFSHSIELSPNTAFPYYYRGVSYIVRKKYDKAIEDFTKVISYDPEDSSAFMFRGIAYKRTDNFDKAKADMVKAIELNPGDELAIKCLEQMIKRNLAEKRIRTGE